MIYGSPVFVPRDADKELMEGRRAELEQTMRKLTERADNFWG